MGDKSSVEVTPTKIVLDAVDFEALSESEKEVLLGSGIPGIKVAINGKDIGTRKQAGRDIVKKYLEQYAAQVDSDSADDQ